MTKRPPDPVYPIRAVARLTGLGIDTLRAWERRHAAVTPSRDHRGRVYTEADVRRLRLLRQAVDRGHPIGRIAALPDAELSQLAAGLPEMSADLRALSMRSLVDLEAIHDALNRFDNAAVEASLGRAATMLRPQELLRQVIVPVLADVGDAWYTRRASVAHEHLVSAIIRNVLGSFLRLHAHGHDAARLLLATPEGERHEFGALGAAMLAASGGLDALYLGPDLPAADLVDCATTAGADVVVLGVTAAQSPEAMEQEVATVARKLPRDVELWIGGRGAARIGQAIRPQPLVVADYDAFEGELARVGARW
jgi:DNA-binding transcriptional MerR regulator/methylmalonyl-CoA mutase cobalamin-binding subunit